MAAPIRILLVDDHSLFRESLSRLLAAEPEFRIVGSCASATEALALLDREKADVVLLDYDLGEEQGLEFLEASKRKHFPGRVLMVTAGMSEAGSFRALENGASGIFLKHSPPAQLVEAIHKIASGEAWLDPKAVRSLVAGAERKIGRAARLATVYEARAGRAQRCFRRIH